MEGLAGAEAQAADAQAAGAQAAGAQAADVRSGDEGGDEARPGDGAQPEDGASAEAPLAPPATRLEPTHRVVRIVSVEVALPDQFPTVTLEDVEDLAALEERRDRLAFRIGTAEGVALAHALNGTAAPRPLTHDLFALSLERYGVEVLAVRLTGRIGATYLAEIELVGPAGRQVLSCRPSDGICLALRQRVPAPVLCDERLFAAAGDVLPDDPDDPGGPGGLADRAHGV